MRKIEVLVSSLRTKDVETDKYIYLMRGDHYPADKIDAKNLEQMVKLKYVKLFGEETKTKTTRKKKELEEVQSEVSEETQEQTTGEDGDEF